MELGISSWNAQGGCGQNPKLTAMLHTAQTNGTDDIILVQEAGPEATTGLRDGTTYNYNGSSYKCVAAIKDPTAGVHRCTTSILVKDIPKLANCKVGSATISVERAMPFVVIDNKYVIATIHAIANRADSISQVKNHIRMLYDSGRPCWLLMGDFNSCPEDYSDNVNPAAGSTRVINGTDRVKYYDCFMDSTRAYTQGAGGVRTVELDFAFHGHGFQLKNLHNHRLSDGGAVLSDHNMIGIEISDTIDID